MTIRDIETDEVVYREVSEVRDMNRAYGDCALQCRGGDESPLRRVRVYQLGIVEWDFSKWLKTLLPKRELFRIVSR